MALIRVSQLLDKTFYVTRPLEFYRVMDVNNLGDKARPVKNKLKTGYAFILDSYLAPLESATTKNGVKLAARSSSYFTFKGKDGNYYAVKFANDGRFSLKKLQEQGVKTIVQEAKEKEEEEKTPIQTIKETTSKAVTSAAGFSKNIIYIGIAVLAAGYLLPKILKK